ncbi:MAG: hydantoin racemase [Proteobacteria bacterium]|nr:hydantoin racemase [Pseudomonadota bacterium]
MKILVVNGNTTDAITQRIGAEARAAASPGTEIVAVSAPFGARVVGTRAENAIAAHAVLDAAARHHAGCDAVVVAISSDAGTAATRELLPIPVLGITEAALLTACTVGGAFGVLTFGARVAAWSHELVASYGLTDRLAAVEALDAPAATFTDPDSFAGPLLAGIERLVAQGADSVAIAGAAFAGCCRLLQARAPVPLLDGVACAVGLAEMRVRLGLTKPRAGSYAEVPARELSGVDAAICTLFGAKPTS